MVRKGRKRTREDLVIDSVVYSVIILVVFLMMFPILNVVAISFSDYSAYLNNPLMIFPKNINLEAFLYVMKFPLILSSYVNTIIVAISGTALGITLTMLTAYPLSIKELKGKAIFMNIILFTMLFSGGLIPNFYLIKSLGLYNTLGAITIPGALSAFNIILMKNFFSSIPDSLKEAAKIDGASEVKVLTSIIIPLSKPIIATICLFLAVMYWNSYFGAVIYIRDRSKWTLQLVLREVITAATSIYEHTGGDSAEAGAMKLPPITLQYATLIVAILPILCVYPFLQKYFVKGVMVGAVKG